MNLDVTYQLISIALITVALLYFYDKICQMKFSFWRIFVRTLITLFKTVMIKCFGEFLYVMFDCEIVITHDDTEPADWLINHLYYVGFLLLVIGHVFSLTGLIQQIGTTDLHNKPTAFFISPLFNQIGLVLSYAFITKREHIRIKRLKRA